MFAAINHMRTTAYKAPAERDKVSTEDLVRERLRDGDKERRQMNRWRERRSQRLSDRCCFEQPRR